MWALLRLAVASLLFGVLLPLLSAVPYFLRLSLTYSAEREALVAKRFPYLWQIPAYRASHVHLRVARILRDFFGTLCFALLLILFLYWQSSGSVRFFSLASIALGGLLSHRLLLPPLKRLLWRVSLLFRILLGFLLLPFSFLLGKTIALCRRLGAKVVLSVIKTLKRYDTILVSKRYYRHSIRYFKGGRLRSEISAALLREDEGGERRVF